MPRKLKSANTVSATAAMNLRTAEAAYFFNDALFAATQDVMAEIEFSAAERVAVLDKETADRFPGELRDSIRSKVTQVKAGAKGRVFTETDAEWRSKNNLLKGYGGFLELGTARSKAEPFIYPAFEEKIGDLPEAVKDRLEELTGQ